MKKGICLLLAMMMLFGTVAYAQTETKAELCVSGLGIMQADENGDFNWDGTVTRAEFVTMAMRLLRIGDVASVRQDTPFTDVDSSHWASGYVKYATEMGLINGVGDGKFSPDEAIRFNEIIKILIHILGYDVPAQEMGGYPQGYIALGGTLGLYKQVSTDKETLTRAEIAQVIYNAMDVVPLEKVYGSNDIVKNEDNKTLYELLTEQSDILKISGILQETEFASLRKSVPDMEHGYVLIDNVKYKTDMNLNAYLGYAVEGYIQLDQTDDMYKIMKMSPMKNRNTVAVIPSDDAIIKEKAIETIESGKTTRYTLDDNVQYVYNGRYTALPTETEKTTNYGEYRLLDRDDDDAVDVVFVQQAESFIVDRVNTENKTIYLANKDLFRGKSSFKFDYDDGDNLYELVNADGETIGLEDISANDSVTFMVSADDTYAKVVVGSNRISGEVEEIIDDDTVVIAGEQYTLANHKTAADLDMNIGDSATYAVDVFGGIIGVCGEKKNSYEYGYIVEAGTNGVMASNVQLRIVTGMAPEKEVKTSSGTETISYYFQNDTIRLYDCASKVEWNGVSKTLSAAEAASLQGQIIAYSTDANGLIKEMMTYEIPSLSKNYTFNGNIVSFGGTSVTRGYATDGETVIVCVPDVADEDDDYYIRLKLTDGATGNKVYGVNVFPKAVSSALSQEDAQELLNAQPVNILIIQDAMDASSPQTVSTDADICIVGNVTSGLGTIRDDEGSTVYKLELLNGTKRVTEVTKSSGDGFKVAATLRKGDLIQYVKDGFGRIINIRKLASVQGLKEYGEVYSAAGEGLYGLAYDIELDTYDYKTNQKIDRLLVSTDGGETETKIRIFYEDPQPIYRYERSTGYIYPATTDDITAYNQIGDKACKIYAQIEDNDATVIIIIED